jgi:two-component system sensor kinase FixL
MDQFRRFQIMVETAHDAIFFKDLKSRYVIANSKTLETFGLPRDEVIGRNDLEIMANRQEAKKNIDDDRHVFRAGKPREITKRMTGANGKEYWFRAIKVPQFDRKGRVEGLVGIARDVTEQVMLEREVAQTESRERARVGLDLHDGLGQQLTGVAFRCKALETKLAQASRITVGEMAEITRLVEEASEWVRHLSKGLSPVEIEPGGLSAALAELAITTSRVFRIRCTAGGGKDEAALDATTSAHLYRIAQEAVTNAVKHGKPRHITIRLSKRRGKTELTVRDDGVGIPKRRAGDRGAGLRIMKYRAESIDAKLDIARGVPRGTVVRCLL